MGWVGSGQVGCVEIKSGGRDRTGAWIMCDQVSVWGDMEWGEVELNGFGLGGMWSGHVDLGGSGWLSGDKCT